MAKATMDRTSKVGRARHPKRGRTSSIMGVAYGKAGSLDRKSIAELAAEQGVKPTRLEDILGKGADLWESDQEFERFVEDIYARRREDRELAKS